MSHGHRHHAYLDRSQYADQIERLFELFGRDRVLVEYAEDFFAEPEPCYASILDFLGLPQWRPASFEQHNARPGSPLPDALQRRLADHFAPTTTSSPPSSARNPRGGDDPAMKKRTLGPSSVQAEPPLAPTRSRSPGTRARSAGTRRAADRGGGGRRARRREDRADPGDLHRAHLGAGAAGVAAPGLHAGTPAGPEGAQPRDTTMDTEAQLVWSDEVLRLLATFPGFDASRAELRDRIDLSVPNSTHVLTIRVRAGTAGAGAQRRAGRRRGLPGPAAADPRRRPAAQPGGAGEVPHAAAQAADPAGRRRGTGPAERPHPPPGDREADRGGAEADLRAEPEGRAGRRGAARRHAAHRPRRRRARRRARQRARHRPARLGRLHPAHRPAAAAHPAARRRPAARAAADHGGVGGARRRPPGDLARLRNLVFDAEATTVLVTGVPAAAGTAVAYELAELCTEGGSATTVLRIRKDGEERDPAEAPPPRTFAVRLVRSDDDRQLTRAVDKADRESRIVVITPPTSTPPIRSARPPPATSPWSWWNAATPWTARWRAACWPSTSPPTPPAASC